MTQEKVQNIDVGDYRERTLFSYTFMNNFFSILKFSFRQINSYDLRECEGELRKIILQKYRFYNPFSRSGTSQEVKNTAFWYKANLFCAVVKYDPKKRFHKGTKKISFRVHFGSNFTPPGYNFFLFNRFWYELVSWELCVSWCHI